MSLPAVQDSIFDQGRLADLKRAAGDNSPAAIRKVAQQFEAMFMQMVLKQMREAANFGGASLDGEAAGFYRGLADQQLVQNLSQSGRLGLAQAIERQLLAGAAAPTGAGAEAAMPAVRNLPPAVPAAAKPAASTAELGASGFIEKIWQGALSAAQALGVPAHFIAAQAALETGWGKGEIRRADGRPSYNLFNIKASADWKGEVVESLTTEYVGGVARQSSERFRAYSGYAEAFADYARLLSSSPRYRAVSGQTDAAGFAHALQQGGYATDPMYAEKLKRLIGGNTLRNALGG